MAFQGIARPLPNAKSAITQPLNPTINLLVGRNALLTQPRFNESNPLHPVPSARPRRCIGSNGVRAVQTLPDLIAGFLI
jgi:hypothetical protein